MTAIRAVKSCRLKSKREWRKSAKACSFHALVGWIQRHHANGPQPATVEAVAEGDTGALDTNTNTNSTYRRAHAARRSSLGAASHPPDGACAATLIDHRSATLHRANTKARGFSGQAIAPPRVAIAHNELVLHYQPHTLMDGEITEFKALIRWRRIHRGTVPPLTLIPMAEENGQYYRAR